MIINMLILEWEGWEGVEISDSDLAFADFTRRSANGKLVGCVEKLVDGKWEAYVRDRQDLSEWQSRRIFHSSQAAKDWVDSELESAGHHLTSEKLKIML